MARLPRRTDLGGRNTRSFGSPQPPHRAQDRGRLVAKIVGVAACTAAARGFIGNEAAKVTDAAGGRESEHVIAGIRPLSISS